MPGVVQDGNGQIHVRGDHNNLTYRVNGILLPESLMVMRRISIAASFNPSPC
ncbi:MAG: hypothetical protein AAYR33_06980 [Acetobacteraceae bacterium]